MNRRLAGKGAAAIAAAGLLCPLWVAPQAQAEDDEAVIAIEDIFVVGTRRPVRSTADTPAPIDLMAGEDFSDQGATELPTLLRTLVPSYNVSRQPINDESTFVRPANLRGLGPDQTLIFVNGKRRHRAAVIVNLGNGVSDGAQGPDIGVIPSIALKRVEVLRDTASAQYGSDAIAGVINFVLKDRPDGGVAEAQWGQTYEGDGGQYRLAGNVGLPLGESGFANLSAQWRQAEPTARSRQRPDAQQLIDAGYPVRQPYAQIWGAPDMPTDYTLFLNSGVELGERAEFYAFGNLAARESEGGFFFRNPNNRGGVFTDGGNRLVGDLYPDDGVCPTVAVDHSAFFDGKAFNDNNPGCFVHNARYPGGYTPQFKGEISDTAATAGVRGRLDSGLTWDVSYSFGRNSIDYSIRETINPNLGPDSPSQFEIGSHTQSERVLGFDATYPLDIAGLESPLYTAAGIEWREEKFEIGAGEEASWAINRRLASQGFAIGSHGYAGFRPETAGSWTQDNVAGYIDLEADLTPKLTVATMGRVENYDSFGSTADYRLGALYQVTSNVGLRGSASTGFRAPTPGQQNISRVATVSVGEDLVQTALLSPSCPEAIALGARPLEPETAETVTLGAVVEAGALSLTADIYNIDVQDRLGVSADKPVDPGDEEGCLRVAEQINARFYGNGFDTRTRGLDVVATVALDTGAAFLQQGETELVLVGNWTETSVTHHDPEFLNENRLRAIEEALPEYRFNATLRHEQKTWRAFVRLNYFGPYTPFNNTQPLMSDGADFTMSSEITADIEVGYSPMPGLELSIGAQNIFDNYPDDITHVRTSGELYPENAPMSIDGGFYYARARYTF